ncbi:MAG: 5'/3'-nucleotidase SurE [Candidatus Bilamarchaeaceae archaeon]
MKTIAVTNDDGHTEGAMILLRIAKKHAEKAYAVLPNRQRSAISAALTLHKPLRLIEHEKDVYTLSGNPADCAIFAIHSKKFPKPDMILSGINWGDNAGMSPLISSGTIGACWKAALYSVPSIAFSLYKDPNDRLGWLKAGNWRSELLEKKVEEIFLMLKPKLKNGIFFVVNLPSVEYLANAKIVYPKKLQPVRFSVNIDERFDPYGHPYYWIGGEGRDPIEGSDLYEIAINKNITIKEICISSLVD